jgi:hypothetical protein
MSMDSAYAFILFFALRRGIFCVLFADGATPNAFFTKFNRCCCGVGCELGLGKRCQKLRESGLFVHALHRFDELLLFGSLKNAMETAVHSTCSSAEQIVFHPYQAELKVKAPNKHGSLQEEHFCRPRTHKYHNLC